MESQKRKHPLNRKILDRILAFVLVVAMLCVSEPVNALSVYAADNVTNQQQSTDNDVGEIDEIDKGGGEEEQLDLEIDEAYRGGPNYSDDSSITWLTDVTKLTINGNDMLNPVTFGDLKIQIPEKGGNITNTTFTISGKNASGEVVELNKDNTGSIYALHFYDPYCIEYPTNSDEFEGIDYGWGAQHVYQYLDSSYGNRYHEKNSGRDVHYIPSGTYLLTFIVRDQDGNKYAVEKMVTIDPMSVPMMDDKTYDRYITIDGKDIPLFEYDGKRHSRDAKLDEDKITNNTVIGNVEYMFYQTNEWKFGDVYPNFRLSYVRNEKGETVSDGAVEPGLYTGVYKIFSSADDRYLYKADESTNTLQWVIAKDLDLDVPGLDYKWQITVENGTINKDNLDEIFTSSTEVVIKPKYDYYGVEYSLDGVNYSETLKIDSLSGSVKIYMRDKNGETYSTVKDIVLDSTSITGSVTYKGVSFGDVYEGDFQNRFFVTGEYGQSVAPLMFRYTVYQKTTGSPVTEIAWAVVDVTGDTIASTSVEDIQWTNIEVEFENNVCTGTIPGTSVYPIPSGQKQIWLRITDKSGSIKYISTDNIIVYQDIPVNVEAGVSYTPADPSCNLSFTLDSSILSTYIGNVFIKQGLGGEYKRLVKDTDYAINISGYQCTIALLSTAFGEATVGEDYYVKVELKPFGYTIVDRYNESADLNGLPNAEAQFRISVGQSDSKIEIDGNTITNGVLDTQFEAVYNGEQYNGFNYKHSQGGEIKLYHLKAAMNGTSYTNSDVSYYESLSASNWTAGAPKDAGYYIVKVVLDYADNAAYKDSATYAKVYIKPREVGATIEVANKDYDGNNTATVTKVIVNTTIEGKNLYLNPENIKATFASKNAGDNQNVEVTYVKGKAGSEFISYTDANIYDPTLKGQSDKYENYIIVYHPTQASIKPRQVQISFGSNIEKVYGAAVPNVNNLAQTVTITNAVENELHNLKIDMKYSTSVLYNSPVTTEGYDITAYSNNVLFNQNYRFEVTTKVMVTPKEVTVTWGNASGFIYTAEDYEVAATISGAISYTDSFNESYKTYKVETNGTTETKTEIGTVNCAKDVGTYITEVVINNPNYKLPENSTKEIRWEIKDYVTTDKATLNDGQIDYAEGAWYLSSTIYLKAPSGYMISHAGSMSWDSKIKVTNLVSGNNKIQYRLKNMNTGYITYAPKTIEINVDTIAPVAKIEVKQNGIYKVISDLTKYFFAKKLLSFKVNYTEIGSGVKLVEYAYLPISKVDLEGVTWTKIDENPSATETYTKAVDINTLTADEAYIVHIRITDKAGNVSYANSNGVVIYQDSALKADTDKAITYTKFTTTNHTISVNFIRNTIDKITIVNNTDASKQPIILSEHSQYNVNYSEGTVTFMPSAFDSLNTNDSYTIKITLKPLGYEFTQGDEPATLDVALTIAKAAATITVSSFSKLYDGKPVSNISYYTESDGVVSYEYYDKDQKPLTYVPKDAGSYYVKVKVAESDTYQAVESSLISVRINTVLLNAYINIANKVYDGNEYAYIFTATAEKAAIEFEGLVNNEKLVYASGLEDAFKFENKIAGLNKKVVLRSANYDYSEHIQFLSGEMYANPANYDIHYEIRNAAILKRDIKVEALTYYMTYPKNENSNSVTLTEVPDDDPNTGLVSGDSMSSVVTVYYKGQTRNVGTYNYQGDDVSQVLEIVSTNYNIVFTGNGVTVVVQPRDIDIKWQAQNSGLTNNKQILGDPYVDGVKLSGTSREVWEHDQNDTVIYNGKPYTVGVNEVSGVIYEDKDEINPVVSGNTTATTPGEYEVSVDSSAFNSGTEDNSTGSNPFKNYWLGNDVITSQSILDDFYYSGVYKYYYGGNNDKQIWRIKYLDDYYEEIYPESTITKAGTQYEYLTYGTAYGKTFLTVKRDKAAINQTAIDQSNYGKDWINDVVGGGLEIKSPAGGWIALLDAHPAPDASGNVNYGDAWKTSLIYSAGAFTEGKHEIYFALKNTEGYITSIRKASINIDRTNPTGTIELYRDETATNPVAEFLSNLGFEFFDQKVMVKITAEDVIPTDSNLTAADISGIKEIRYMVKTTNPEVAPLASDSGWISYSNNKDAEVKCDKKAVVYARIMDNAGNCTIINSETGIVVYDNTMTKDVNGEDGPTTVVRDNITDLTYEVKTNGYKISSVTYGVLDGQTAGTLVAGTDYSVTEPKDGKLTFTVDADFINDKLKVNDDANGTVYKLVITYAPLDTEYTTGDKPVESVITIKVDKAESGLELKNANDLLKEYDGLPVVSPIYTYAKNDNADRNVTITFAERNINNNTYGAFTEDYPKNAGYYGVKIEVAGNDNYKAGSIIEDFRIYPKQITITLPIADKIYDKTDVASIKETDLGWTDGFATGVLTEKIKVTGIGAAEFVFDDTNVGTNKVVTVKDANSIQVTGVDGTDSNNYSVTFNASAAAINRRVVTLTVNEQSVQYGDTIPTTFTYVTEKATADSDTGLIDGDELNTISFKTDAVTGSVPKDGNYDVELDGEPTAANDNYYVEVEGTGKLVITKRVIGITWAQGNVFTYDTQSHTYVPEIAEGSIVNNDVIELKYEGHTGTEVQSYKTTVTGIEGTHKDYYVLPTETQDGNPCEHVWSIEYDSYFNGYSANLYIANANGSVVPLTTEWTNQTVRIYAPAGTSISETKDGPWWNYIEYSSETALSGKDFTYYLKVDDANYGKVGAVSAQKSINIKIDRTNSRVEIKQGTIDILADILESLTLGLFYREEVTLNISAEDSLSGINSIEYLVSDSEPDIDDEKWTTLTTNPSSIKVEKPKKGYVFVKVTDNAGNVKVYNSRGIVVFTNSTFNQTNVEYVKRTGNDLTLTLALNGNTIKALTINGTLLTKGTDYTIVETASAEGYGTLKINDEWLDQRVAGDAYTVVISYNPVGVEYNGTDPVPPVDTTFTLNIQKNQTNGYIDIKDTFNTDIIYDGKGVDLVEKNAFDTNLITKPVVKYKLHDASDSAYTTQVPTEVGVYDILVSVPSDSNYLGVEKEFENAFEIKRRPVTVVVKNKSKGYDGNTYVFGDSDCTVYNLADGHTVAVLGLTLSVNGASDAGTYNVTGTVTNRNYDVTVEGDDALTIQKRPVRIIWTDGTNGTNGLFTYTATEKVLVPVITNKIGNDTINLTIVENKKTEVGSYTARVTALDNDNYTLEGNDVVGATFDWSISYDPTTNSKVVAPQGTLSTNGWYFAKENDEFKLYAPTGYSVSTNGTDWNGYISTTEGGEVTLKYYIKNSTGAISEQKEITVKIDRKPPTGEINVKNNLFTTLLNNITFGYFFKNTVDVTITAADPVNGSGYAKIEYQIVTEEKTEANLASGEWTAYEDAISISPDSKVIIYARITDNVGHVTYINSQGLVIYTDMVAEDARLDYVQTSKIPVFVKVGLVDGILVDKVKVDGAVISADNYTLDSTGKVITFEQTYLETLAVGRHNVAIGYKLSGTGDTPADTEVVLNVIAVDKTMSEEKLTREDFDKIYDGTPVTTPSLTENQNNQTLTYEYKLSGATDSNYSTTAPINAGDYIVRITAAANEYADVKVTTIDFTIAKKAVTVETGVITALSTDPATVELNKVIATGLVGNHKLDAITVNADTSKITTDGTYTLSDAVVKDPANGTDVSANYEFTYKSGKLVVNHNTTLAPESLVVEKDKTRYNHRDTVLVDDLKVTAIYSDGYTAVVNGFTTNVDDIDTTVAGTHGLVVTYNENGGTVEETVDIVVVENPNADETKLNASHFDKEYDGTPVVNPDLTINNKGQEITYQYKLKNAVDSTYTNVPPTDAGNYVVKITANEYGNAQEIISYVEFSIAKKTVMITSGEMTTESKKPLTVNVDDLNVTGLLDGHRINSIETDANTAYITNNGSYTLKNAVVVDAAGRDVSANYNIIYSTAKLTVTHNQALAPESLSVEKTTTVYDHGQELNVNDLTVTVTYSDGFTKEITEGYVTNASELNMYEANNKNLEVSYTENGGTVTDSVRIVVVPNVDKYESNLTAGHFGQIYNGEPVDNPDLTINNNGQTVTYEYKVKGADDSTYTDVPPTNAGDYTVRITAVENDKYEESVREVDFRIEPKSASVSVSAGNLECLSNETIEVDVEELVVEGLLVGHYIETIDVDADTSKITTNGIYTLANAVVKDADGNDVSANYDFNYGSGSLVVNHNPELKPISITANKTNTTYNHCEEVSVDDIVVTVTYSDGYTAEVSNFDTNVDDIDTTVAGSHNLVVYYTEKGETVETTVEIVVKADPSADETELDATDFQKDYDGTPVTNPDLTVNNNGQQITYEYKEKNADDSTYTDVPPTNAGDYTVKITAKKPGATEEDVTYVDFTIKRKEAAVSAGVLTGLSNETVTVDPEELAVSGLLAGHKLESVKVNADTSVITENGTYTLSDAIVVDADGNDVSANYDFTYGSGKLVVNHNPEMKPVSITANKTTTTYNHCEEVSVDDIVVTVTYPDGYTTEVNNFTTNVSDIDTTVAGTHELVVSYTENGETVETAIEIVVKENPSADETELDETDFQKDYDGTTVTNPEVTVNNKGQEITYEYKVQGADDSTYTNVPPTNAGDYTVRITAGATSEYPESITEVDFTISRIDAAVSAGDLTGLSNTTVTVDPTKLTTSGFLEGHYIASIDVDAETGMITENGTYTLENAVVKDAAGNDVTENYNLTYGSGKLVVSHNPEMKPSSITANKETTTYDHCEEVSVDDIVVTVTYPDGYTAGVNDFTTNVNGIDTTVAGTHELVVSYTENGKTVETVIAIVVNENPNADETELDETDFQKDYDGTAVTNPDLTVNNNGQQITYEYKEKGADDSTYTSVPPTNAGDYTVRITAKKPGATEEDVTYVDFTIGRIDASVSAGDLTGLSNTTVTVDPSTLNVVGLLEGHYIASIDVNADTSKITENGTYTLSNAVVKDSAGNNVTANYNITYASGKLVVKHNTALQPSGITANKETIIYDHCENVSVDDIVVTVTYPDGYTVEVNNFTTNVSDIDTTVAGEHELVVYYTENGKTVETVIEIVVNENPSADETELDATDFQKEYDGTTVTNPEVTVNNKGQEITYEYKLKGADDSTYTSEPPTNAGDYTVRIIAEATDEYPESITVVDFTIECKDASVSAGVLTGLSNEVITVDPSTLTAVGLFEGHYIESIDVNADTSKITENGTYTLSNAVVKDAAGNDVSANYNFTYEAGRLVVSHNPSYTANSIRIEKQTVGYKVGDVFKVDDVKVFVVYNDGYETEIIDYVTNAAEIDMTTDGIKVFKVTCSVNGTVLASEIFIDVTQDPGKVGFEVIHVEDAPETTVKNNAEELKNSVLTDEDKELVANGEDYNIYLEVKNMEDEVPSADKAIVEEFMKDEGTDKLLGMYIDISLYKKIGENPATYVKSVDAPIEISIKIPDELISRDENIERTYYILRIHEGVPTIINGTFNKEDNSFVFTTDRFSTYAIMYKDVEVAENPTDDKEENKAPQTGDDSNVMLWLLLMTAGCGMVVLGKRKKYNF